MYQAAPLPTGRYAIAGETFELFIKHTHEQAGRRYYEAVFGILQQEAVH